MTNLLNIAIVLLFLFKYNISNLEIDSFKELTKDDLAYIENEYINSSSHYPAYLKTFYKVNYVNTKFKIKLFISNNDYINDERLFKQSNRHYQGIFHPLDKAIYLPYNNIKYLSHELAHAFNYENNLFINSKLNEEAANGFESYLIFKQ